MDEKLLDEETAEEENRFEELYFFLWRGLAFLAVALVLFGVLSFASKIDKYGKDGLRKAQTETIEKHEAGDGERPVQMESTEPTEPPVEATPEAEVGTMDESYIITLTNALPNGAYTLRYEGETGVLDTYAEICTLRPGEMYNKFIAQNTAPQFATRIGVFNEDGTQVGHIPLAPAFVSDATNKLYSFAVLSDVHIGQKTAEEDFKNALTYLSRQTNISFICVAGDLTEDCTDDQLKTYKNIVDKYAGNVAVYAVPGDHDTEEYRGSSVGDVLKEYTGRNLNISGTKNQDVFLILGTNHGAEGRLFTREQLQWLQEKLEANRDRRCFILTHVRPEGTVGGNQEQQMVAVWDGKEGIPQKLQTADLWGGTEAEIFESLLNHYANAILMHGHSHIGLAVQEKIDAANYDGAAGYHSIHIPALFGNVTLDKNGNFHEDLDSSEGLLVDVYADGIVVRGIDFIQRKSVPLATYYLNTQLEAVEAGTYEDATVTINCGVVIPEWDHNVKMDEVNDWRIEDENYSSTGRIMVEKDQEYYVHQHWGCTLPADVIYYNIEGKPVKMTSLWTEDGYTGPVQLEITRGITFFRIIQQTDGAAEECTKDIFLTHKSIAE